MTLTQNMSANILWKNDSGEAGIQNMSSTSKIHQGHALRLGDKLICCNDNAFAKKQLRHKRTVTHNLKYTNEPF